MGTITAAALSVALLTTPPPPAGLHTTPSKIILTWRYMERHHLTSRTSVGSCGGCHMVIVPARKFRGLTGVGYTPIPPIPLPSAALLFGTALGGLMMLRWRRA